MAVIAPFIFWQLLDNNGDPLNGGKLYAYEAGTTTPKDTFNDESGDTANTNPVVLDASGRADVWLGVGEYKFSLFDSADNLIKTVDNISGVTTGDAVSYDISTTTNITSTYNQARIFATNTISLNLLAAADAGDGFEFYVKNNGTGTITLDPDAAETINSRTTLEISADDWAIVYCDGTEWQAFVNDKFSNYEATTAPTVSNDTTEGYTVGSRWYDTTADEAYVCLDATTGAAVWVNTTLTIDDLGNAVTYDVATQSEAEAGTSSTTLMTPQRVQQAIGALYSMEYTTIPAATGTGGNIPEDNTTPLVSEGTEIATDSITPANDTLRVRVQASFSATNDGGRNMIAVLFRGSTAIAACYAGDSASNKPNVMSFNVVDSPATASAVTYSIRFGKTTGAETWYVNQVSGATLGGVPVNNGMTLEAIT